MGVETLLDGAFWGDRDAHAAELAACLHGLGRIGVALDKGAQFADAGVGLLKGDERLTFVQVGYGDLAAVGVLFNDLVVGLDGVCVLAGTVFDLALVVVGVSREGMVGVELDEIAELGGGERILGGHVVA